MHTELDPWRESGLPMREAKGPDRNRGSEDDLSQEVILHVIGDGLAQNTVAEQLAYASIINETAAMTSTRPTLIRSDAFRRTPYEGSFSEPRPGSSPYQSPNSAARAR
jgi:hypothetical protein